jgi:hypothetical protein
MDLAQADRILKTIGDDPTTREVADAIAVVLGTGDAVPEGVVWRVLHTYAQRSVLGSQFAGFGTGKAISSAPENWYATVGCVLRDCPGKRAVDRRDPLKGATMSAVEQALWRKTTAERLQAETIPVLEREAGQGDADARVELEEKRVQLARVLNGSAEEIRDHGRTIRLTMMDSLADLQASPEFLAGMRYLCKAFWRCARKDRSFLRYVYLDSET